MRYLAPGFIGTALKQGRSVAQFLGPVTAGGVLGIAYVELRRTTAGTFEGYLHCCQDVGSARFMDVEEFPPLADADGEEDFGQLIAVGEEWSDVTSATETATGAVRSRWVNASVLGDEYGDFVHAGRPATAPGGNPWPTDRAIS